MFTDTERDARYEKFGSDFEPKKCDRCVPGGPWHTACLAHNREHCTADWCF